MLVKCPECELQVSDKALSCPHCGYPMPSVGTRSKRPRRPNKRRRLPNGFGQISEIKNKRLRKPYRVMVPVGKTQTGKCLTSAWAYCGSIYNMRARDVRARHLKGCMEEGTAIIKGETRHPSAGTKSRMKSLFNLMFDYALEYEIVEKNYARTFNISQDVINEKEQARRGHLTFSDEEINTLWENINKVQYTDVILIQCYSGWRPQELGLIRLEDVDLENWVFSGGLKTEAGRNRKVPIHTKIRGLVQKRYDEAQKIGSKYLINCTDTHTHRSSHMFTYDKYRARFDKIKKALELNPEHRCHDGRMHFITQAKKYDVDEYAIKYMVGHAITDLTERVYTKREFDWLKDEIEKIK